MLLSCRSVGWSVGRILYLAFLASLGAVSAYEVLTSLVSLDLGAPKAIRMLQHLPDLPLSLVLDSIFDTLVVYGNGAPAGV